ncbi:unnamed protein product [Caenorhabditis auriculariae]|uniref:PPM-type phosphatase domain-containing protein n=1 Tax=Caenorhabditis auriculariae TaxID=2777116 RepID=A0A8S1HNT9_9PELO|nr:unnamed protein product [Caenorhabditis auriculariae]
MNSSKRPGESLYTEEELNGTTAVKKPREDEVAKKEEAKNGNLVSEAAKTTHTGLADVLHAYGARRGEREDMQDAHLALSRFELANLTSLKRSSLFAIFDGHAGARAAEFCEKRVAATLRQKLSSYSELAVMEKGLKKAFTESFKTIDEAFLNAARQTKPVWKDGTTITTMLVLNNVLYVANLGDSKAVVARTRPDGTLSAICLTVDHNPTVFEERMRIQKTGATVKDGRVNGVIEVSRSIGDGPFKSLGVTCLPDMKKLTMTENDRFFRLLFF